MSQNSKGMKPDRQPETRTIPEHDLDRLLKDLDAVGRLVLSARRLPGGRVVLTITAAPRRREKAKP